MSVNLDLLFDSTASNSSFSGVENALDILDEESFGPTYASDILNATDSSICVTDTQNANILGTSFPGLLEIKLGSHENISSNCPVDKESASENYSDSVCTFGNLLDITTRADLNDQKETLELTDYAKGKSEIGYGENIISSKEPAGYEDESDSMSAYARAKYPNVLLKGEISQNTRDDAKGSIEIGYGENLISSKEPATYEDESNSMPVDERTKNTNVVQKEVKPRKTIGDTKESVKIEYVENLISAKEPAGYEDKSDSTSAYGRAKNPNIVRKGGRSRKTTDVTLLNELKKPKKYRSAKQIGSLSKDTNSVRKREELCKYAETNNNGSSLRRSCRTEVLNKSSLGTKEQGTERSQFSHENLNTERQFRKQVNSNRTREISTLKNERHRRKCCRETESVSNESDHLNLKPEEIYKVARDDEECCANNEFSKVLFDVSLMSMSVEEKNEISKRGISSRNYYADLSEREKSLDCKNVQDANCTSAVVEKEYQTPSKSTESVVTSEEQHKTVQLAEKALQAHSEISNFLAPVFSYRSAGNENLARSKQKSLVIAKVEDQTLEEHIEMAVCSEQFKSAQQAERTVQIDSETNICLAQVISHHDIGNEKVPCSKQKSQVITTVEYLTSEKNSENTVASKQQFENIQQTEMVLHVDGEIISSVPPVISQKCAINENLICSSSKSPVITKVKCQASLNNAENVSLEQESNMQLAEQVLQTDTEINNFLVPEIDKGASDTSPQLSILSQNDKNSKKHRKNLKLKKLKTKKRNSHCPEKESPVIAEVKDRAKKNRDNVSSDEQHKHLHQKRNYKQLLSTKEGQMYSEVENKSESLEKGSERVVSISKKQKFSKKDLRKMSLSEIARKKSCNSDDVTEKLPIRITRSIKTGIYTDEIKQKGNLGLIPSKPKTNKSIRSGSNITESVANIDTYSVSQSDSLLSETRLQSDDDNMGVISDCSNVQQTNRKCIKLTGKSAKRNGKNNINSYRIGKQAEVVKELYKHSTADLSCGVTTSRRHKDASITVEVTKSNCKTRLGREKSVKGVSNVNVKCRGEQIYENKTSLQTRAKLMEKGHNQERNEINDFSVAISQRSCKEKKDKAKNEPKTHKSLKTGNEATASLICIDTISVLQSNSLVSEILDDDGDTSNRSIQKTSKEHATLPKIARKTNGKNKLNNYRLKKKVKKLDGYPAVDLLSGRTTSVRFRHARITSEKAECNENRKLEMKKGKRVPNPSNINESLRSSPISDKNEANSHNFEVKKENSQFLEHDGITKIKTLPEKQSPSIVCGMKMPESYVILERLPLVMGNSNPSDKQCGKELHELGIEPNPAADLSLGMTTSTMFRHASVTTEKSDCMKTEKPQMKREKRVLNADKINDNPIANLISDENKKALPTKKEKQTRAGDMKKRSSQETSEVCYFNMANPHNFEPKKRNSPFLKQESATRIKTDGMKMQELYVVLERLPLVIGNNYSSSRESAKELHKSNIIPTKSVVPLEAAGKLFLLSDESTQESSKGSENEDSTSVSESYMPNTSDTSDEQIHLKPSSPQKIKRRVKKIFKKSKVVEVSEYSESNVEYTALKLKRPHVQSETDSDEEQPECYTGEKKGRYHVELRPSEFQKMSRDGLQPRHEKEKKARDYFIDHVHKKEKLDSDEEMTKSGSNLNSDAEVSADKRSSNSDEKRVPISKSYHSTKQKGISLGKGSTSTRKETTGSDSDIQMIAFKREKRVLRYSSTDSSDAEGSSLQRVITSDTSTDSAIHCVVRAREGMTFNLRLDVLRRMFNLSPRVVLEDIRRDVFDSFLHNF